MNPPAALDPVSARLETRLLDFIGRAPAGFVRAGSTLAACYGMTEAEFAPWEQEFDALALELFRYQAERMAPYAKFASMRPVPDGAAGVPALPVDAFKHARLAAFPPQGARLEFHTSGTTVGQPGIVQLDSPALYDAALERGFVHHVLPEDDRMRMLSLVGRRAEMPHSSLAYMLDRVLARWGGPGSGVFVRGGVVQWPALAAALREAERVGEPVCLLGTAFAWVHVLEHCEREGFHVRLAPGSRLLETGGYKGRSRELSRETLYAGLTACLGIPATHLVSEYGMTELGSQYYTAGLRSALLREPAGAATWSHPLWLRPRLLDPERGRLQELHAATGLGLLAHHDLANRGSVAHVLTGDLAVARDGSFELAGRCPRSSPRGCGLTYEATAGSA